MNNTIIMSVVSALGLVGMHCSIAAEPMCASGEQAQEIQTFYKDNPGTPPIVAARQLKMSEELIASTLPADQAASAGADAFAEIWTSLTTWNKATVIISKGADVIEVFSPISPGSTSTENPFFNLSHDHALGGHLRPDLYTSIYAYSLPGKKGAVIRGVYFYDQSGASVFGVMMSGKGPQPPAGEIVKYEELMSLIRSKPPVCGSS